jgi:hypothetical protein
MWQATTKTGEPRRGAIAAVLAAVWLCLGLQPCAMAGVGDSDCPQCPSVEAEAMPAGHDHGAEGGHADCDGARSSCCEAVASVVDGRSHPKKADDGDDVELALPSAGFELIGRRTGPPDRPLAPPVAAVSSRRLHLLNCVFRD